MRTMQLEVVPYLPSGASHVPASIQSGSVGLNENFESGRAAFQDQLYHAQSHLLQLLGDAPRYMSAEEISPVVHSLQRMVDIVRVFHTPSRIDPASTVDSHVGEENGTNIFSDITGSSATDQTGLSYVLPDSTQIFCGYDQPPNDVSGSEEAQAMPSAANFLAHVYDPPVFNSEIDIGDAEFYRYFNP